MKLKNKVAIVTGGARGIGDAIVRAYADEGAKVVIADVETAAAEALASELGAARAIAVKVDVRDRAQIAAAVARTVEAFGGVDILVVASGMNDVAPIVDMTPERFQKVMLANVDGGNWMS